MKVVFDHSRDEAANIKTFFFRPERPVYYTAGQYAEWSFDYPKPDKRGSKRWFTISSSPTEKLVSFTTRLTEKTGSSFKKALWKLELGAELQMSQPMGDFVLPKLIQTPLIFVAAGIGITPFHSILSWLADTKETRPIKMLYGVRNEDDIIFQDTMAKAGVHPTIVVSNPTDAWGGERGHITAELIVGLEQPTDDTLVYLSGPESLVEKLEEDLIRVGLPKRQIVTDAFLNYQDY